MEPFDPTVLDSALDTAQTELESAELASVEASARAEKARDEVSRLKAAVAALNGESAPPEPPKQMQGGEAAACLAHSQEDEGPNPSTASKQPSADDTQEDIDAWEKERERKLRAKKKEHEAAERAANPLYDINCTGCGQNGVLQQTMIQAPSGIPLQAVVCTSCGNMLMS